MDCPLLFDHGGGWWRHSVTPTIILTTLKAAVTFLGPTLDFLGVAPDVSTARIPFEPPVPWRPCFVPTLASTMYQYCLVVSVGGAATKCFANFTSKPNLQCEAFQPACFSMALSFCFPITKFPACNSHPAHCFHPPASMSHLFDV